MVRRPAEFREAFTKGLRRKPSPKNQDRLAICFNAKPDVEGLRGWTNIPRVGRQDAEDTFPFPQLFVGRELVLIAHAASLSKYNPTSGEEIGIPTFNKTNTSTPASIVPGESWQFVDFGPNFILTNGSCVVFKDGLSSVTKVDNRLNVNTICSWRGRVFSGGFSQDPFTTELWKTFFNNIKRNAGLSDVQFPDSKRLVLWSTVGTSDFAFRWLVYPAEAFTSDALHNALLRNELGFMEMPFQGRVLRLMPHVLGVVVYCENGIALLRHSAELGTFGLTTILNSGIPYRAAVAGNERLHGFVDTKGALCFLDANANVSVLGYEEFLAPMLVDETVVSYRDDPEYPEFYICSQKRGFCLTTSGLGEQHQLISSVGTLGGVTVCTSTNLSNEAMHIELSDFDGGLQGLKELTTLRLSCNRSTGIYGRTKVSYEHGRPYITTRPRMFNPSGGLILQDSGNSFRICVDCPEPAGLLIEQLNVEIAYQDKRFLRAIYAQETNQSADQRILE